MSECACGCGSMIQPSDPSPDYKYIQCHALWMASQAHPDPGWWRSRQRYLYRLLAMERDWSGCFWEYETTDNMISLYDQDQGTFDGGLTVLVQRWLEFLRVPVPEFDIDVAVGV